MSGDQSQQQVVYHCEECGKPKRTVTREVTFQSTTKDSKTKHHQGSGDLGPLSGDVNHRDSETMSTGSAVKRTENFFICPTPGCPQRASDRWDARRWEVKNNPTLDDSPEFRNQEMDRVIREEKRNREEAEHVLSEMRAKEGDIIRDEKTRHRRRKEVEYRDVKDKRKTDSSRRSPNDTPEQSNTRNIDALSDQLDQQTTATAGESLMPTVPVIDHARTEMSFGTMLIRVPAIQHEQATTSSKIMSTMTQKQKTRQQPTATTFRTRSIPSRSMLMRPKPTVTLAHDPATTPETPSSTEMNIFMIQQIRPRTHPLSARNSR